MRPGQKLCLEANRLIMLAEGLLDFPSIEAYAKYPSMCASL